MLVLSRKKNESIVINDDITIVVVEIRGDKVRLGSRPRKRCRYIATKSMKRFAAILPSRAKHQSNAIPLILRSNISLA